jgi:solute carrier family 35, member E1
MLRARTRQEASFSQLARSSHVARSRVWQARNSQHSLNHVCHGTREGEAHMHPRASPKASAERTRNRPLKVTGPKKTLLDALYITLLFAAWYLSNIYFNIYNKQVLNAFGHAAACTWIHLAIGSALAGLLWLFRIRQRPTLSSRVIDTIFPLAILHLLGFYTTNASLGAVAVSLTHTIKAMEPFFTVVISWLLLGTRPAKRIVAALVPIVIGVCVASATDLSFNWMGFNAAMLSNVAFQTRNVLSKKTMLRTSYESLEGGTSDLSTLDEVNIFALMSIGACIIMLPFVVSLELPALLAISHNPSEWMTPNLWLKACLAGIFRCVVFLFVALH